MKKKDIEKCTHVTLSTEPAQVIETMLLEIPNVKYFWRKAYGGRQRYDKATDQMLDRALAEERSQYSDFCEYISPKGNRWFSFHNVEYFPKAKHAHLWPTSFIYYETYASCGAFIPTFKSYENQDNPDKMGAIIYTAHFFQRMADRTGKLYRSRELIREFITTMDGRAVQTDEDGDVIVRFTGGHGFGVVRSEKPLVLEVRTFLTDEQLTPKQKRMCEKVDAYSEILKDGMFIKDVAVGTMYYSENSMKDDAREIKRMMKIFDKLGMTDVASLAILLQSIQLNAFCDLLNMPLEQWTKAQITMLGFESREFIEPLVLKYKDSTQDHSEQEFTDDVTGLIVKTAKKMELKSITEDRVSEWMREWIEKAKAEEEKELKHKDKESNDIK